MSQRPAFGLRTGGGVEIRFEPLFVEEAVFLTLRERERRGDRLTAQAFRTQRDALYERRGISEEREAAFERLALQWFCRLGVDRLFAERFQEIPWPAAEIPAAVVRRAWTRKEELVELYAQAPAADASRHNGVKRIGIGVQVIRCLDPGWLIAFLRQELWHVADMLDPAFGYDPALTLGGSSEAQEELIRGRFRVLWDLWVESRMRRRDWPTLVDRGTRRLEFERAFAHRTQWTQRELVELARGTSQCVSV